MKTNLITFAILALAIAFVSGCASSPTTTTTTTTERTKSSMYAR